MKTDKLHQKRLIETLRIDGDDIEVKFSEDMQDILILALEIIGTTGVSSRTAIRRAFDNSGLEIDNLPARKWRLTHKKQWKALHSLCILYLKSLGV